MEEMTERVTAKPHVKEGGHMKAIGKHMFSESLSLTDVKLQ